MVYGVYDSLNHLFCYSTAGHEPGFLYRAADGLFIDMETKGLVLGVSRDVEYPEYTLELATGDAIILFSDGVTECRIDGEFITREQLQQLIATAIELPAQQAVDMIRQKLFELSNYKTTDDQTIMMIKREE
jgi:phosphoserine phosphatase RsbU/P